MTSLLLLSLLVIAAVVTVKKQQPTEKLVRIKVRDDDKPRRR